MLGVVGIANDGIDHRVGHGAGVHWLSYEIQPDNPGLGYGLNRGVVLAAARGAEWVLFLDQDTCLDADFLPGMADAFSGDRRLPRLALLAPNFRDPLSRRAAHPESPALQAVAVAITSGSLMPLTAFRALGPFREDFFIEGLDVEYCLRAAKHGWRIYRVGRPLMTHSGGQLRVVERNGRRYTFSEHSAWRYYLQFRNAFWTILHHGLHQPKWCLQLGVGMIRKIRVIIRFETDRRRKLVAIARGSYHGLIGRLGAPKR